MPKRVESNNKMWPFFIDYISALNSLYILILVPKAQQPAQHNRKGQILQNIFIAYDFNINFISIVLRQEGSAYNSRIFAFIKNSSFYTPLGHYYLADASYTADDPIVLILYQKVRYYLKEQAKVNKRPKNQKELFNLRHASLRNVIKRVFSVLKACFSILNKGRKGYSLKTQVKIIQALTVIYNFININSQDLNKKDSSL